MHVLGHVLIWLIALGALAATVLTTKAYDVRNSWIKKVDQLQQDVAKNEPIVAEKEARLDALKEEVGRVLLGWGAPFVNVDGQLNNNFQFNTQDPALVNWLASLDQTQQASQVVYVFQPQPDNTSLYIGSFQLSTGVQAGGAAIFNPTWTPRGDDFAAIQNPNGPFRVRPMVPAQYPASYADIRGEIALTERLLGDKQADLAEQKQREADAKAIRDKRNEQLQGANGFVAQLKTAEDARNLELDELDHWRRKVDDARQEVLDLLDESRKMEQQLEQPASGEVPPVTAQVTRR